ncbi:MAG TPA: 2Fe-2S iron-sulfur cluster binding domain-containing protein [Chloroflexi bacterium]|nr:MAG: hypothetical protein B6243_00860 [Anaerolineaceae bacterium 4572_5.2]HEY83510.1 2Fe-2S iron-sulfur cluster binding domain-containing protein [Chloroflexota bacterium]
MWKNYYTPTSLQQALELLDEFQPNARIIAGGTDLILEIEKGIRRPEAVIDISRLNGLDTIWLDEDERIHLGPTITHNQVIGSTLCRERAFPLVNACWQIGSPQIRNRGTVAGNLITASPANDTISPMMALDASVTLASVDGERTLSLKDFFLGVRKTALTPQEMLVDIHFPAMQPNQVGTFEKLGLRRAQAISIINVAVVLTFDRDKISDARITLGSVAPTIIRAPKAEAALIGQSFSDKIITHAANLAAEAAKPIDDLRGSASYRRYSVGVYTRLALTALRNGEEKDHLPDTPIMLWSDTDGHYPYRENESTPHTEEGEEAIVSIVNGEPVIVRHANDKTLLRMLREDLYLTGTKEGCAEGECGACTVLLDGVAVMSCLVPAPRAHRSEIITVEGLMEHPLQESFIKEDAVQCGYCTPGFLMSGASLLLENEHPTPGEIKQGLTGNLCRCTGYYNILKAFEKTATTS